MTILLPMLAFLLATGFFFLIACRDPTTYGRDRGLSSLRGLPFVAAVTVAALACLLLTVLPPKGFHDLSLRYLGMETVLPKGGHLTVGGDLAAGHFLSGVPAAGGAIFQLENRGGSLWLKPETNDLEIRLDDRLVAESLKVFAAPELEEEIAIAHEVVTISVASSAGSRRYRLERLPGFVRSEQQQAVTLGLHYERPFTEPIFFPPPDPDALVLREAGVLLLTNRPSSSAHDELRLPVPPPAGPVIAKLEKAPERDDAVLLITPRERLLLEIGSTAKVEAYSQQRWVLLQLADQTILDATYIRLFLLVIFVPSFLLLATLLADRRSPAAIVVYLVALFLLSFRFVIGVRAASLYPYHYEALALALAGLVLLPLYALAIPQIGPVAAGIAGVPGRLTHAGGRHHMRKHLAHARGLGELLLLSVLTAITMAFIPGGTDGSRRDPSLIGLTLLPLALLAVSVVMRRAVLRLPFFHPHVRALADSPALLGQLAEVDAVTRVRGEVHVAGEARVWLRLLTVGVALAIAALALLFLWPSAWPGKTLWGLALLGGSLVVGGGWLWARSTGRLSWLDRGAFGRWQRAVRDRLWRPGSLGHGLLDWWLAPAGRISVFATGLVLLMILVGRRETLIAEPRVPLMLIYVFLFLAMATANMVFISKKAGHENVFTSLLVIAITLVPLAIYSAMGHDYGSAIAMFVPLLAVLAFAVLRRRGLRALTIFFLIALFVGVPVVYTLGGEYLKYRVTSVLRGPSGLEAETSRTAQNTLEQVMQMRFYATAGESWLGGLGYGGGEVGRGLRMTSLNDNVFSVFIVAEMGTAVGATLALIYALLLLAVLQRVLRPEPEKHPLHAFSGRVSLAQGAMLLGLCLSVVFIAVYMTAANTGLAPLTGKNLPFLGLNSKSDMIQHLLVFAVMISMLLRGLVTPSTATVVPVQMAVGDLPQLKALRYLGALLFVVAVITAGWTLGQWWVKPGEVIRFTAYNDMLQRLTEATNDFGHRDRILLTRPDEQPPFELYRNENGVLQMEIIGDVVDDFDPNFRNTLLLRHVRELNRTLRQGSGRSIFRLRRVAETGKPQYDYELRSDPSYMRIVSPFRGPTWQGEILAREQSDRLALESLGGQQTVEIAGETYMGLGRELRLVEVGRQVLLERVDDIRTRPLGYKVNGFDFAAPHPSLPPPKFLVLREDDFVSAPQGIYLLTYTEDRKLSKVKTVNGKLERAFPEGESFYYAQNLTTSLAEFTRLYGLDEDDGTLRLTLDADLNRQIFDRIEPLARQATRANGKRRVAVTVMDLESGDLLALASAPSVNPNLLEGDLPDYQQILYENHNLRTHPMGSAIKPLFAGAALLANPELLGLRVEGRVEQISQLAGYPLSSAIASGGGANSVSSYLERSSNSYEFYLSVLALAAHETGLELTDEPLDDPYQIFLGNRQLNTRPELGGRLRQEGQRTWVEKLDESRLARGFAELFDILYSSEASTYFETQLWQPLIDWIEAKGRLPEGDRAPSVAASLAERLSVEASLPDISLIAFDRMTSLRSHYLSTTLGGAEGRLHNVRVAEALARLATGKMVQARLMTPFLLSTDASDETSAEKFDAQPITTNLAALGDLSLEETARGEIARGLVRVIESRAGTAAPRNQSQRAALAALQARGLRVMGKTGTHYDTERTTGRVIDSIFGAVIGEPESARVDSRLRSGLAVVVYVEDTVQHSATEVFYNLLPILGQHFREDEP